MKIVTEEIVKYLFAQSPVDFHEVGQAVKILHIRDQVGLLGFLRLLAGIVKPEEAALLNRHRDKLSDLLYVRETKKTSELD